MIHCNGSPIDPAELLSQLRDAIEEDEKYKRENAAKFRAIEQSKTYEEFRNIVKASHLRPLEKHDSLCSKNMKPAPWNSLVNKKLNIPTHSHSTKGNSYLLDAESKSLGLSGSQLDHLNFRQHWQSLYEDLEGRLGLLQKGFLDGNMFKGHDIPADLIVGIFETLNDSLDQNLQQFDERCEIAIKLIIAVSSTPRFSLHVLFLNEKEKISAVQLKKKLKTYVEVKGQQVASGGGIDIFFQLLEDL